MHIFGSLRSDISSFRLCHVVFECVCNELDGKMKMRAKDWNRGLQKKKKKTTIHSGLKAHLLKTIP